MLNNNKKYLDQINKSLKSIFKNKNIKKAAILLKDAYKNKKNIYTFGTGHSHMIGEELYARAGGWNYIKPMLLDEITLSSHPFKSTYIERIPQFADVLLNLFPLNKDDIIIITSNSGRNGLIVEMALRAKEIGAKVIAITSLTHSSSVSSRHDSKKLLKDIADIVIDNTSPSGDAIIEIGSQTTGPISTITGIFIAHQIIISTMENLEEEGIKFETFISSNLDGQDDRNKGLL